MKKEAWILLYKKFLNWEWYDHPPTKDVFLHCLLTANFMDESWKGQIIKRGQFPTSVEKLATILGLSNKQTRTALKNLQTTDEISIQTTNRYSIITVKNYDYYQPNVSHDVGCGAKGKQKANKRHAKNPVVTGESRNAQNTKGKQRGGSKGNTINNINKERDNKLSLSLEEREILKNYLLKTCRKNIEDMDAYIRKLIDNGDASLKLEKAMKRIQRQKEKENIPPPKIENQIEPETISRKAMEKGRERLINTLKQTRITN